jgi:hypothetical protein
LFALRFTRLNLARLVHVLEDVSGTSFSPLRDAVHTPKCR